MARYEFNSVFSEEIQNYVKDKDSAGFKSSNFRRNLIGFDKFCIEQNIDEPVFTTYHASKWLEQQGSESHTTHYSRVNASKHFLKYLSIKGYDVFVVRDIKYKGTDFQPHIYSDTEVMNYFLAVDSYSSGMNRKDAIQYPVLFRILYCCGTRINETLGIRKKDIDLKKGIILLNETKNDKQRYIVLGDDLLVLISEYANKCFYLLCDEEFIFTNANGGRIDEKTIYEKHREFLFQAGIPYIGGGNGPRIHDCDTIWQYILLNNYQIQAWICMLHCQFFQHTSDIRLFLPQKNMSDLPFNYSLILRKNFMEWWAESLEDVLRKKVKQMKTTDFATLLSRYFTKYLPNERASSPQTIDTYRNAFILYLEYMEAICGIQPEKLSIGDYTRESILGFLNWLEDGRGNSSTTRNYRLAAMKGFIHYLKYEYPDYMHEYQRILGIPLKKTVHNEISYLKTEGVELLVRQIDLTMANGMRDYVIILILYTTGVRVTELINIKVKDISLTEPYTLKIHGKGNKGRYVPLMKTAVPYIKQYLAQKQYDTEARYEEYLFKNHMNEQFTRQGINYVLKKYATKARNVNKILIPEDLTAHKMRHTTAMELLASGVDLMYIRDLLGHSSVTITEVYARTDAHLKRMAIEAASKEILPSEDATWDTDTGLKEWLKSFNKR